MVKNLPVNAGDESDVGSISGSERFPGEKKKKKDSLEEEMATHSSILTWRIPWTDETGGL